MKNKITLTSTEATSQCDQLCLTNKRKAPHFSTYVSPAQTDIPALCPTFSLFYKETGSLLKWEWQIKSYCLPLLKAFFFPQPPLNPWTTSGICPAEHLGNLCRRQKGKGCYPFFLSIKMLNRSLMAWLHDIIKRFSAALVKYGLWTEQSTSFILFLANKCPACKLQCTLMWNVHYLKLWTLEWIIWQDFFYYY